MAVILHVEDSDVESCLGRLGWTRGELMEVLQACVAAHSGCTDNDPPTAKGWELWRWGVRRLREIGRPKGLEKDDTDGFSTVVDHDRRLRFAVICTDEGTGLPDQLPQNRNRKGPASERAASTNEATLPGVDWPFMPKPQPQAAADEYTTWHLCIYVSGDDVRAELSVLIGFEAGYFTACHERIIIVGKDGWLPPILDSDSGDSGPEFDVPVRRKWL